VKCFCTAHSFQETIAHCIEKACEAPDQVQTEKYAQAICSAVEVRLPSFQELLVHRNVARNSTDNMTNGNGTVTSKNSTTTASGVIAAGTVRPPIASATATGDIGSSATGFKFQAGLTNVLVVAGIGFGMFL
jgi:hypothetical protein